VPNLRPNFIEAFSTKLGLKYISDGKGDLKDTYGPEDVFYYAYAVFHSPIYRERYADFLKIDFPRLPFISDKILFARLADMGEDLVGLHLLKSPKVDDFISTFPETGNNTVEKVLYAKDKVWINATQYFGGVPEDVWEFKVGGYQVCEKWLKDRKGRALNVEDITHYQCVVVALNETIRLMQEIDKTIPVWPME
jgi:predicted helicase